LKVSLIMITKGKQNETETHTQNAENETITEKGIPSLNATETENETITEKEIGIPTLNATETHTLNETITEKGRETRKPTKKERGKIGDTPTPNPHNPKDKETLQHQTSTIQR